MTCCQGGASEQASERRGACTVVGALQRCTQAREQGGVTVTGQVCQGKHRFTSAFV